ncbi:MAG: GNAT family N-acetyltransferase [Hyphomicrobiaceae bacterium]
MPASRNLGARAPGLEIRSADLDHWSEIRNLHATSLRHLTGLSADPHQLASFTDHIYEPEYSLTLQSQDFVVAWYDRQLIGTAGWVPFDGRGLTARLTSVCVSPLFTRLGVGRCLVEATEERAALAGYRKFATRVFPAYAGFFDSLGYVRTSQGVQSLGDDEGIPVVFMRKSLARAGDDAHAPEAAGPPCTERRA